MARRSGFIATLARAQREIEMNQRRAAKAYEKRLRELDSARAKHENEMLRLSKEAARAQTMETKARAKYEKELEKERRLLYLQEREDEVERKKHQLESLITDLNNILELTLTIDDWIDLEHLKTKPIYPTFSIPQGLSQPERLPSWSSYEPERPHGLGKFMPGATRKYEDAVALARARYSADMDKAKTRENERQKRIDHLKANHESAVDEIRQRALQQHAEIDDFKNRLNVGQPDAIVEYCELVLEASLYPDGFPQTAKLAYVPESKQLVIEYELPTLDIIPQEADFKYVKSRDEITVTSRPMTQRKALYASVIAQITLRTIHEIFEADRLKHIESIVFNGHVDSIDRATGQDIHPCLITLRTTREMFSTIDLARVDPELCLKNLSASVSKNPAELAPVRPVVDFNMVDPRFVAEADVLSTLDTRQNLMELTPSEFESLITNLFHKMGLEARQTQASRDGGVDCVAWDPRPIFGGKVIIQAKRYKNTVGVSAVRDLFGTLQNEGASKGILVTTSGYGKAAFEFAQGKPLELLDGSNLLYLLSQHAGIEAKIEIPEAWRDPVFDVAE